MNRTASLLAVVFLSVCFHSGTDARVPAHRPAGTDYKELLEKYKKQSTDRTWAASDSAESAAGKWSDVDIQLAPEESRLNELFNYVRDTRELTTAAVPNFLRRIPWLYPHDGCWIRASIASQWAEREGYTRPSKLFIFGNLSVQTSNAVNGSVSWWYHVVPAVRSSAGDLMVIDPAIDPAKPMNAVDWIKSMVADVDDATLSLCSTYTYEPFDDCDLATSQDEQDATTDIRYYLDSEWRNLKDLGREPSDELGDKPPWKP